MLESPATRESLLVRIRDRQDPEAWRQFLEIYAPAVYAYARRRGLQDADAADLMQDVMRAVSSAAGRLEYDPARGTFRGWLYTIARNKLFSFLDGRRRKAQGSGDSDVQERLAEQPAPAADSAEWDRDAERRLACWAMNRIRGEFQPATWDAFWLTAVEGQDAKSVAAKLGLSPGAVYVAKSRVLARLKREVRQAEDA
jgi:RNA polymerase sigma factor (sigma-70 family)